MVVLEGRGVFLMSEVPLYRGALINRWRNLPRTTTRTYLFILCIYRNTSLVKMQPPRILP